MVWKLRGEKVCVEVTPCAQWKNKDKHSDGAQLILRNSVLSRQTALDRFFWFPVMGQFQIQHEFVCTVVLHTPTNMQQSVSRECYSWRSPDPHLWFWSGPLLVSLWSRNKPYRRTRSDMCLVLSPLYVFWTPLTLFNKRIASDPKISVPHEEPKAHFRYTDLAANVTDCSAACGLVMTLAHRALNSLMWVHTVQVDTTALGER